MARWLVIILLCWILCLVSCGEYEKLAVKKESEHVADSLFREHRDSLNLLADSICNQKYPDFYNRAVDSIKETQLVKIKKLIDK